MTDAVKESILSKIQKLLALGQSSNQAEAEAALAKAQELMIRHNIEMQEVNEKTRGYVADDYTVDNVPYDFTIDKKYICDILRKFFFVDIVDEPRIHNFMIIGTKDNVAIAQFLRLHIRQKFNDCWQTYKIKNGLSGVDGKKNYYYGLWVGLCEKLQKERTILATEKGLIVVNDEGLAIFREENGLQSKRRSIRPDVDDQAAIEDGVKDGRKIKLNDRIGGGDNRNFTKTLNLN